jgi:hypothetical protein
LTHVRGNVLRTDRTDVIQDSEIQEAIENARRIKDPYFQLRAVAVLSLLRISGKRRGEVAIIPLDNFSVKPEYLEVKFILEKKRTKTKLNKISTKQFPLDDPLTQNVIEYLNYLEKLTPKPKFWLPTGKAVFGTYIINPNKALTGRQVFNIVRNNSEKIWPHLNRETVGADVVAQDDSINAVFKVQQTLDLENFETAFRYVKRFSKQIITRAQ